jgi:hypothetical protein
MNTAERLKSPMLLCTINHHHHHYAAGTGHQTAFILSLTTWQQDQAVRLPNTTQQHHQYHPLALEQLHLGQQDLAVSLSLSFGNQPFGITVGKLQA